MNAATEHRPGVQPGHSFSDHPARRLLRTRRLPRQLRGFACLGLRPGLVHRGQGDPLRRDWRRR